MDKARLSTRLFEREGKDNIAATLDAVVEAADDLDIRYILILTGDGESALTLRRRVPHQRRVFAVTFPHEMRAQTPAGTTLMGMPSHERRLELASLAVPIIQGSMPFIVTPDDNETFRAVRTALNVFGGGVQLCVQAILMACDAGHVDAGERCIAMSADTAVVARAGHSWNFFLKESTLAIEHFLCKPQYYQISRGAQELEISRYFARKATTITETEGGPETIENVSKPRALPLPPE